MDNYVLGTIVDYGVGLNSKNNPQVTIRFEFELEGSTMQWNWFGSMNEGKAREITLKTLIRCGFTGNDLNDLNSHGALNVENKYSLALAKEEYQGQEKLRIKWVNTPGYQELKKIPNVAEKAVLSSLKIAADLVAAKAAMTYELEAIEGSQSKGFDEKDELPF